MTACFGYACDMGGIHQSVSRSLLEEEKFDATCRKIDEGTAEAHG